MPVSLPIEKDVDALKALEDLTVRAVCVVGGNTFCWILCITKFEVQFPHRSRLGNRQGKSFGEVVTHRNVESRLDDFGDAYVKF